MLLVALVKSKSDNLSGLVDASGVAVKTAKAAEVDPILRIIRQQEACAFEPVKEMLLVARLFYPHLKFLVNVMEKSRRIGEDPLPLALRRGRIAKLATTSTVNTAASQRPASGSA